MGYKLKIAELAHNDIDEIVAYIMNELQNETAAIRFLDALDAAYVNLAENPYMYEQSRIPRLLRRGYRKIVIMNYILLYLVDEENKTVHIARLFYGKRDYAKYL
jgi:plasmid stabilization system protein ParE